jgi:fatty acid desaturase
LRAAGLFEPHELDGWAQLVMLVLGVVVCLTSIPVCPHWAALLLVPAAGVMATSAAMLGHEGSHKSFSKSPARNSLLAHVAFPVFSGLSAMYWHDKHDVKHHGHPNVARQDADINPWPFTMSLEDHETFGPKMRWFQRNLQRWLFWPMSCLMAIGMRRSSVLFLVAHPKRRGIDREWALDAVSVLAHYVLWLVMPALIWGPMAIVVYLATWGVSGVCLSLVFAPAHIGMPVLGDQHHDWLHQVETTRNLEMPRFASWFFIGLDYQVEHHLFPKIPHQSLPAAAAITRAWCTRHGIRYHSEPYLEALADSVRFIGSAWARPATDRTTVREGRWIGASVGLEPGPVIAPPIAPADVIGL